MINRNASPTYKHHKIFGPLTPRSESPLRPIPKVNKHATPRSEVTPRYNPKSFLMIPRSPHLLMNITSCSRECVELIPTVKTRLSPCSLTIPLDLAWTQSLCMSHNWPHRKNRRWARTTRILPILPRTVSSLSQLSTTQKTQRITE